MWDKDPNRTQKNHRGSALLIRLLVCIAAFGISLYSYIEKQNVITRRRLEIPKLAKEIKELKEVNTRLQYEIDLFESPEHLIELARHAEFCHLKQPFLKEVLILEEGIALQSPFEEEAKNDMRPKLKFAIGANTHSQK